MAAKRAEKQQLMQTLQEVRQLAQRAQPFFPYLGPFTPAANVCFAVLSHTHPQSAVTGNRHPLRMFV